MESGKRRLKSFRVFSNGRNLEGTRKENGRKAEGSGWNSDVLRHVRSEFFAAERTREEIKENETATCAPMPAKAPFETGANAMKKGEAAMDSAEQAAGEKRVRQMLVDPLMRRGLAKPTSLTKVQFGDMVEDLCARLAYMSEQNLMALEEQVAANPGGKEKDRFPIGQRILEWAAQIQPPGDDASPLIRAVFANQLGKDALNDGWAPELLADLRHSRRWPGAWTVKTIKDKAGNPMRQLRDLDIRLARGEVLTPTEEQWRSSRLAAIARCQRIADLGQGKRGGGRADG